MAGSRRWNAVELATLQDKYGKIDIKQLSVLLNRSVNAIQKKASDLGVEFNPHGVVDLNKRLTSIEALLTEILGRLK